MCIVCSLIVYCTANLKYLSFWVNEVLKVKPKETYIFKTSIALIITIVCFVHSDMLLEWEWN